jgi:hypothetical protein
MRIALGFIVLGLLLVESGGGIAKPVAKPVTKANVALPANAPPTAHVNPRVDFETQLKPIFKSHCMPCHFQGGQMYDRLPFDKPDTIRKLGTRLFTRIKDENDRRLIEEFLKQSP